MPLAIEALKCRFCKKQCIFHVYVKIIMTLIELVCSFFLQIQVHYKPHFKNCKLLHHILVTETCFSSQCDRFFLNSFFWGLSEYLSVWWLLSTGMWWAQEVQPWGFLVCFFAFWRLDRTGKWAKSASKHWLGSWSM